jgi:hypothetical protein
MFEIFQAWGGMEMIEYEQQDYDVAKKIISLGFFMDLDKKTES